MKTTTFIFVSLKGFYDPKTSKKKIKTIFLITEEKIVEMKNNSKTKAFIENNLGIQLRSDFAKEFPNSNITDLKSTNNELQKGEIRINQIVEKELGKKQQLNNIEETLEEADNIAVDNQTQLDLINEQTANKNQKIYTLIIIIFAVVLFLVVSVFIVKNYYSQKKTKILEKNVVPVQPEKSKDIDKLNKKLDFEKRGIETKSVGTVGFELSKGGVL